MATRLSSVGLVLQEAAQRGLATHSFESIHRGFAELTCGDHTEYIFQSQSNLLGRVTARLFTENKVLTSAVLRRAGFPVPANILTNSQEVAEAFLHEHGRVVIKPIGSDGGKGVTPGIATVPELAAAIAFAAAFNTDETNRIVCEQHLDGSDVRVLVVGQRQCFAMERIPAQVMGDGRQTIAALVAAENMARAPGYDIKITSQTPALLAEQGHTLTSVLPAGTTARLARVANAHAGGTTRDVTSELSAAAQDIALRLAAHFDCPLVGVDFITPDLTAAAGHIIEVNACPDISIHYYPSEGRSHNIAALLLDMLFPETVSP